MYHCQKNGVYPNGIVPDLGELIIDPAEGKQKKFLDSIRYWRQKAARRKKYKYQDLLEEEAPNPGKSYAEYLAESLKRPTEKRYYEIYYTHFNGSQTSIAPAHPEEARGEDYEADPGVVPEELQRIMRDRNKSG